MKVHHVTAVGFSHLQALVGAQLTRNEENTALFGMDTLMIHPPTRPSFEPWVQMIDGQFSYNEKIGEAVAETCVDNNSSLIALSLWSNHNFIFSTANDPRRFDFVLPGEDKLPIDPAAELLPYDLVKEFMRSRFEENLGLVEFLMRYVDIPAIMISAPPPIDELEKIPPVVAPEAVIEVRAAELGIAPPALRYKFWKVCESVVVEFCRTSDLPFIPPPEKSWKPDGFRRPEYWSRDWLHANPAYGDLVLRQIGALL